MTLRDYALGTAAAVVLVLVYALIQTYEEGVELRQKAAVQAVTVCPTRIGELIHAHTGFTRMPLDRPNTAARLSCYYVRPVKG